MMTDERLAELERITQTSWKEIGHVSDKSVRELIAEVRRLRGALEELETLRPAYGQEMVDVRKIAREARGR